MNIDGFQDLIADIHAMAEKIDADGAGAGAAAHILEDAAKPIHDQMVVNGTQYLPVNKTGNSTFEIPVAALDTPLAVQAETCAMSEPHMIDYTLTFSAPVAQKG